MKNWLLFCLFLSTISLGNARGADKVSLRTNWLFYGSHAIFFLGKEKGLYSKAGIELEIRAGNGSANAVRLVANGDSTFAYTSSTAMLNLAVLEAPILSVATIDALGTEAILVRPDAGIKTIKELEGKSVMTTAGAGVNLFFPVVLKNGGADPEKIKLVNVADAALVSSYLKGLAPAILAGYDDKPAEIVSFGGGEPIVFKYSDYGIHQPGYSLIANRALIESNPDLVRRFVAATIESLTLARKDPDAAVAALAREAKLPDTEKRKARRVLDVTLSVLRSPRNTAGTLGLHVAQDWEEGLELLKQQKKLKLTKPVSTFYTNAFLPKSTP